MISAENPSGNTGNGSSSTIPIISQWPVTESLPADDSRMRPVAARGFAPAGGPPIADDTRSRPSDRSVGTRSGTCAGDVAERVAAAVAIAVGVRQFADADAVEHDDDGAVEGGHGTTSILRRRATRIPRRCVDCRFARAIEPGEAGLLAEPDQLPLGVAAVFLDDERSRRGLVAHAVQVFERLAIHQPAERTRVFGHPLFEQRPHLVEQAARELLVDAASHACRKLPRPEASARSPARASRESARRSRRNEPSGAGRSGSTPRVRGRSASDRAAESAPPTPDRPAAASDAAVRRRASRRSRPGARAGLRPVRDRETGRASARESRSPSRRRRSAGARAPECRGWPPTRRARIARPCTRRSDRRCRSGGAGCRAGPPSAACRCRCRTRDRRPSNRS